MNRHIKNVVVICFFILFSLLSFQTKSEAATKNTIAKIVNEQAKMISKLEKELAKTNKKVKEIGKVNTDMGKKIKSLESSNKSLSKRVTTLERNNKTLSEEVKRQEVINKEVDASIKKAEDQSQIVNNSLITIKNFEKSVDVKLEGYDDRIKNLENRSYPSYPIYPDNSDIYNRLDGLEKVTKEWKVVIPEMEKRVEKEEYWTGLFKRNFGGDEYSIQETLKQIPRDIEESLYFNSIECTHNPSETCEKNTNVNVSIGQNMYDIMDYISEEDLKTLAIEASQKKYPEELTVKTITFIVYGPTSSGPSETRKIVVNL